MTAQAQTNQTRPLPLAAAAKLARDLVKWLGPHCVTLEIAGSVRRFNGRAGTVPHVNDIDIVAIPKVTEHRDLLDNVIARDNHCFQFLQEYVADRNPTASLASAPRFISGGEKEGKQIMLLLPGAKTTGPIQLDLWFATPETLVTRLICRTGSKEHNIWLADRAQLRGLHWNPYEGLTRNGELIPTPTETDFYAALGLACIKPENRESAWFAKNIDSGL